MTKVETFQILSARDHVRLRPGMYLGSTAVEKTERFVMGVYREVEYVPAINKMIDEIIDNSLDEAIRTKFQHANEIDVTIDGDVIEISDNGRGIPQEHVIDAEGEKILRPVAAWTKTNAGTSFDDERVTIGANGVGSACVNYMSSSFQGSTWQQGKCLTVRCFDGSATTKVLSSRKAGSGTSVKFKPDLSIFGVGSINDVATVELVKDRVASLQVAFPEIKFKFNSKRVAESNIKKYGSLFVGPDESIVTSSSDSVCMFFAGSEDGFQTTSYVNGVNTRLGGTYVDYIVNGVVDVLVTLIKRKYKVEVVKSTIKNGLKFVMFARDFTNPKFDSQTKERLTSNVADVRNHYDGLDFNKVATKVMNCADIIGPIVEAQLAKKMAAEKRAATLAQKKLKKVKVAKHIAATGFKDSTIFLCEGDSALGFLLKVRDPKTVGGYPLRGVVMNTWDITPSKVLMNKELSELVAVLGLDINDPDSIDNMSYQNIATLADADVDGKHITTLLLAFFYKFWPRLFTEKRVHIAKTPILISELNGDIKWFFDGKEAAKFKNSKTGGSYYHRYIKGLASHTEEEYSKIINQPTLDTIVIDDPHWFEVFFGGDSQLRKNWLT